MIFDVGRPLIMAHRGESENIPENTMLALDSAAKIGVDVLESDVHLTKDNIPVLFHDEDLKRTTGIEGTVRERTLEELLEIDLGYTFTQDDGKTYPFRGQGLHIVTLQEAFERFPEATFNLDIKDTFESAPEKLAQVLKQMGKETSVIIASFHDRQIEHFREIMPNIPTSAHPTEVRNFVLNTKIGLPRLNPEKIDYKAFQVPIKSGPLTVVTKKFVKKAHEFDLAIHVWTINDAPTMNHLIDLGVNGIFTDNPKLLKQLMSERGLL